MTSHAHAGSAGTGGDVRLVGAVLLAPLAWLLDMQISYTLVKWACAHGARGALLAVPAGSLALIGLSAWISGSALGRLDRKATPSGGHSADRRTLLAIAGLSLSALFGLLVLTSLVPRVLLSPCA